MSTVPETTRKDWASDQEVFEQQLAVSRHANLQMKDELARIKGVGDVFHLKGGILKYLEQVPEADSLWQGECFVFDGRVSLTHGLQQGRHGLCHACRRPLAPEDRDRPEYEEGVCCHRCVDEYDNEDRVRFRERQRQVARGELFTGPASEG